MVGTAVNREPQVAARPLEEQDRTASIVALVATRFVFSMV
jgi:hypothetical protein